MLVPKSQLVLKDVGGTKLYSLDVTGEVLKVIGELAIRGRTSIIVTHELGFARDVADKIVFMDAGRVVEEGPPADVLDSPKTDRARAFIRKIE